MSTLADELLNDFEDSNSEGEAELQNGIFHEVNGSKVGHAGAHEMDVDGDEDGDGDEEMESTGVENGAALEDADDEEEAKAKVEKMQLGGVSDVRSVAGLMKTLEPVLEVSAHLSCPCLRSLRKLEVYIVSVDVALTCCVAFRKLHITSLYQPASQTPPSDPLRTTQNITFLRNQTPFPPRSITRSSLSTSSFEITTPHASPSWKP